MNPVVYKIQFASGDSYIGATCNFNSRKKQHRGVKSKKKPTSRLLQKALQQEPKPEITIVACGFSRETLHLLEAQVIESFAPTLNQTLRPTPLPPPTKSTASRACDRYNVDYVTYLARRRLGWTLMQSLNLADRPPPRAPKVKKILLTVDGKTRPLQAWAQELGVSVSTMHARRSAGWTDRQVVGIDPPPGKARVIAANARAEEKRSAREARRKSNGIPAPDEILTVHGQTGTLNELCELLSVPRYLVVSRLKNNWTVERAFSPKPISAEEWLTQQKC